jgi:peptidoglycan/xylan/chitin deacetylase (PgdA/CDA1 family)
MMEVDGFDADGARQALWMDMDHLRSLHNEGHVLGLHSHTHPTRVTALPRERQIWELETNTAWLRQATGTTPDCMAYPCGDYDEGLLSILHDQGIRLGFQSKLTDTDGLMEIPRLDHAIAMTINERHADAASR